MTDSSKGETEGEDVSWTSRARPALEPVLHTASLLRVSLVQTNFGSAEEYAERFRVQIADSSIWALVDECPDATAATELRAGLEVVRNASIALRRALRRPDRPLLLQACAGLLDQGEAHLAQFLSSDVGWADLP